MEPNLNKNLDEDDKIFNSPMGFKENPLERQNHFLSLRKNKRKNIPVRLSQNEEINKKYELNQNSYQNNDIIQNFFNSKEKTAFLYDLISNFINSHNNTNCDINLARFIVVQSLNYYKSEEENSEELKKFFTDAIITNLIEIMHIFKKDDSIVYNISNLLEKLTYYSNTITKLITLKSKSLQKIFESLTYTNYEVDSEILKLIYNCYQVDEEAVNPNCNIGVYVFQSLSRFKTEKIIQQSKNLYTNPYFKILISFLNLLINDNTRAIYKEFNSEYKNNIIFLLLVLCRDVFDEELKLDVHKDLKLMLELIKDSDELDIKEFGVCEIVNTFLPHIKLESNNPEIVVYSMSILEIFSFLCSINELINRDLIIQIEEILLTFIDMNENKTNPKFYYKNYSKAYIGQILQSISNLISNSIDNEEDEEHYLENFIINETRTIDYLTLCLKIKDIEEENMINIYTFFKDFVDSGVTKNRFIKLILTNFIEIGIVENMKYNIINKNHSIIKEILEICLLMLKECDKLKGNQANFVVIYLEKKGFVELLTAISGLDFGNSFNSELAKNIHENFFK